MHKTQIRFTKKIPQKCLSSSGTQVQANERSSMLLSETVNAKNVARPTALNPHLSGQNRNKSLSEKGTRRLPIKPRSRREQRRLKHTRDVGGSHELCECGDNKCCFWHPGSAHRCSPLGQACPGFAITQPLAKLKAHQSLLPRAVDQDWPMSSWGPTGPSPFLPPPLALRRV